MNNGVKIAKSVRENEFYINSVGFSCEIMADYVGAIECRKLSADKDINTRCAIAECASPWRACRMCIVLGQVAEQKTLIDPPTGFCSAHANMAASVLVVKHGNGVAYNGLDLKAVVQRVVEEAPSDTSMPIV